MRGVIFSATSFFERLSDCSTGCIGQPRGPLGDSFPLYKATGNGIVVVHAKKEENSGKVPFIHGCSIHGSPWNCCLRL